MSIFTQDGRASVGNSDLLVYIYGSKRIFGLRRDSHALTVDACRTLFPHIPSDHTISLYTDEIDMCSGELVEISAETWTDVMRRLTKVTVLTEATGNAGSLTKKQASSPQASLFPTFHQLSFDLQSGAIISIQAGGHEPLEDAAYRALLLHRAVSTRAEVANYSFSCDCRWLDRYQTIVQLGLKDTDNIVCSRAVFVMKPVLYFFAPEPIEAIVSLALAPQWSFSAIYPVVPTKARVRDTKEHVVWRVLTQANGELKELTTGLDVAYLFWEARVKPQLPDSPPPSPRLELISNKPIAFDPSHPVVNDDNAVLMPVETVTPYLDACLSSLGLHTEARTSFITFWLHSMLKHKHIAFRFLPQDEFEQSAPLSVSPSPDVVTRIFMLFRGVKAHDLHAWERACYKAKEPVSHWVDKVGIDLGRTLDSQLFRVIEWGGMEVVD